MNPYIKRRKYSSSRLLTNKNDNATRPYERELIRITFLLPNLSESGPVKIAPNRLPIKNIDPNHLNRELSIYYVSCSLFHSFCMIGKVIDININSNPSLKSIKHK